MNHIQYHCYTVDVLESTGKCKWEAKARSKENAIKQITQRVKNQNNRANDASLPWWERCGTVLEVYWDSLRLGV